MNNLQVVKEQIVLGKEFKVYGDFENPLFLAKDVAEWIEHSDVSMMLKNIDEDEKVTSIVCTHGGNQKSMFLTEDGLYEVLMLSRKPVAKKFKKSIKKILKGIRKASINHQAIRLAGIETRKGLTDKIKDSGENERMHGHGFSTYTKLAYKLCGISYTKQNNFRDTLEKEDLERVEAVEDMMKAMINLGKQYNEIKGTLEPIFKDIKEIEEN